MCTLFPYLFRYHTENIKPYMQQSMSVLPLPPFFPANSPYRLFRFISISLASHVMTWCEPSDFSFSLFNRKKKTKQVFFLSSISFSPFISLPGLLNFLSIIPFSSLFCFL